MGVFSEMSITNPSVSAGTEQLAELAEKRDEQRQEAEAAQAKELLQQMQSAEQAEKKETPQEPTEEEKRRAHEEAEAKRKAEWEAKKRAKEEAEQAAWENAVAMDDDQLLQASVKRLGDDAERVTRRNMKQCVTEYIQTHCYEDMDFAIAIRTAVYQNGIYYLRSGAGIVQDSIPSTEYMETQSKVRSQISMLTKDNK